MNQNTMLSKNTLSRLATLVVVGTMFLARSATCYAALQVQPMASASPSSLAFGIVGVGLSTTLSYRLSVSSLSASVVITAPSGVMISTAQNGVFTSSLTLAPVSGSTTQTIVVRYAPTMTGTLSGSIMHRTGTNALVSVPVSGTAVPPLSLPPTVTPSVPRLEFGAVLLGQPRVLSYTIAATSLSSALLLIAPPNFTLATSEQGTFMQTLSLVPNTIGMLSQTVFVRCAPTNIGSLSGSITHTGNAALLASVGVSARGEQGTSVRAMNAGEEVLTVAPQPAQDVLLISFHSVHVAAGTRVLVRLVSLLGEDLLRAEGVAAGNRYQTTLDVASVAHGVYVVEVQSVHALHRAERPLRLMRTIVKQ